MIHTDEPSIARSYHEDYLRRRGTNPSSVGRSAMTVKSDRDKHLERIGVLTHQAPDGVGGNLLTDRGAYQNFLESQLERVTSACLTVQSFESKFTDMQNLIRINEQRVAANTKLLSLAQQCTEEIRSEHEKRFESLVIEQLEFKKQTERAFTSLTLQFNKIERSLSHLLSIENRVEQLENGYEECKTSIERESDVRQSVVSEINVKLDDIQHSQHEHSTRLDTLHSSLNHLSFEVEEHKVKVSNSFIASERRLTDEFAKQDLTLSTKLSTIDQLLQKTREDISNQHLQLELALHNKLTESYRHLDEQLEDVKMTLSNDIQESRETVTMHVNSKLQEAQEREYERVKEWEKEREEMQGQLMKCEEDMLNVIGETERMNDTVNGILLREEERAREKERERLEQEKRERERERVKEKEIVHIMYEVLEEERLVTKRERSVGERVMNQRKKAELKMREKEQREKEQREKDRERERVQSRGRDSDGESEYETNRSESERESEYYTEEEKERDSRKEREKTSEQRGRGRDRTPIGLVSGKGRVGGLASIVRRGGGLMRPTKLSRTRQSPSRSPSHSPSRTTSHDDDMIENSSTSVPNPLPLRPPLVFPRTDEHTHGQSLLSPRRGGGSGESEAMHAMFNTFLDLYRQDQQNINERLTAISTAKTTTTTPMGLPIVPPIDTSFIGPSMSSSVIIGGEDESKDGSTAGTATSMRKDGIVDPAIISFIIGEVKKEQSVIIDRLDEISVGRTSSLSNPSSKATTPRGVNAVRFQEKVSIPSVGALGASQEKVRGYFDDAQSARDREKVRESKRESEKDNMKGVAGSSSASVVSAGSNASSRKSAKSKESSSKDKEKERESDDYLSRYCRDPPPTNVKGKSSSTASSSNPTSRGSRSSSSLTRVNGNNKKRSISRECDRETESEWLRERERQCDENDRKERGTSRGTSWSPTRAWQVTNTYCPSAVVRGQHTSVPSSSSSVGLTGAASSRQSAVYCCSSAAASAAVGKKHDVECPYCHHSLSQSQPTSGSISVCQDDFDHSTSFKREREKDRPSSARSASSIGSGGLSAKSVTTTVSSTKGVLSSTSTTRKRLTNGIK